ncbi:TMEM175 family protein [Leifsonia sp. fls2-241-R2A-40a]|uniref:TMEM175 family protein n=1 Tax=Leifsonia sp. fls2-241-R2A-40a TaxID=3040290 RepID=UPI00254E54F1|nr:TMEM175 family protein [Leifsonia sp. fls2-241-R2A-40a]
MAALRTERGLDRLVNFSDATVAIAITLLILPLVDAASQIGTSSFAEFFEKNEWELLAFAVSFAVIARFWVVHHRIFESVRAYSSLLVWLNFLWLFAIVLIPFTANLLSNGNGERPDVYALYIGNLLLATLASQLIGRVLAHNPELMSEEARASIDRTAGVAELLLMAVALVLAVVVPSVGMFWLFLLFLADPVHRLLRRIVYGPETERRPSRTHT